MESPWKTVHVCQSTFLQSRLAKCFSIFRFVLTGLNDCAPVKKPYLQTLDCRTRKKHFWQPKRRWGVQSWRACKTEIRQRFHFRAQIECISNIFWAMAGVPGLGSSNLNLKCGIWRVFLRIFVHFLIFKPRPLALRPKSARESIYDVGWGSKWPRSVPALI